METLRPFQRDFIAQAMHPRYDTAALSLPRGNGKSWLAAHILTRCLTTGDPMHQPAAEYLLCAASIEQARLCYRFVRAALEPAGGYRFIDSVTRLGIRHKATGTRLRILSSNGKTAMGIVGCPLLVADEPGSWEVVGGQLMHDAIQTAQGKPNSDLRVIYIGTVAPAVRGWWPDMVATGTEGRTYVRALQGDPEKWDRASEIRRCNPLMWHFAASRSKLLDERDKARKDDRLRARFLSYRLNVPTGDPSAALLSVEDWKLATDRPPPPRKGRPVAAVDLGGGRAWSAAAAVWPTGRVEACAVAPGTPSLEDQERRDLVPRGTYTSLAKAGVLLTDGRRRVPRPEVLLDAVRPWRPQVVMCDRFRLAELQDISRGLRLVPRVTRWSEASEDIRALRRYVADGPLAPAPEARDLLEASLSVAQVKTDDQGGVRISKAGANNTARDDVAAALCLAAGALSRMPKPRPVRVYST